MITGGYLSPDGEEGIIPIRSEHTAKINPLMIPKEKTNKVRESDEISSTGDSFGILCLNSRGLARGEAGRPNRRGNPR